MGRKKEGTSKHVGKEMQVRSAFPFFVFFYLKNVKVNFFF